MAALKRIFGIEEHELRHRGILESVSRRYRIVTANRPLIRGQVQTPFRLVDRQALDALLLEKAIQAGVECKQGSEVGRIDPERGLVYTKDGQCYQARVIVGADGVNSRIRRSLAGWSRKRVHWHRRLAHCLEVIVPESDLALDSRTELGVYLGYVRHGYAWCFPRAKDTVLGLGALSQPGQGLIRSFDRFLFDLGYRGSKPIRGHALPYGNFLDNPVQGRVILVGDAAGLADPFMGEGIYFALRSGEMVTGSPWALKQRFAAYAKALHSEMYAYFFWAERLRRLALFLLPLARGRVFSALARVSQRRLERVIHYGQRGVFKDSSDFSYSRPRT
jgi:flavin-dependent dehydrogenase